MKFIESNNLSGSDRQINFSLNVIKCIAVFAIICIHCGISGIGNKGLVITALSRFAVPIFFLISGYFSYFADYDNAIEKYRTRIIKLIKLIIVSNLFYFAYAVYVSSKLWRFTAKNIFDCLIFNFSPTAAHLWFLQALLYCYILYYFMGKLNFDYKKLYKYIPILLIAALFLGEFCTYADINVPLKFYRNFLFMGLPFFALGYLIHDRQDILSKISNRSLIYMMAFGCFLTVIETLTVMKVDLYIGTIILSAGLFMWCIKNPNALNFKITGFIGANLYTSMYVLQLFVSRNAIKYFGRSYLSPIIAFIISLIISLIIYFIIKGIKKRL